MLCSAAQLTTVRASSDYTDKATSLRSNITVAAVLFISSQSTRGSTPVEYTVISTSYRLYGVAVRPRRYHHTTVRASSDNTSLHSNIAADTICSFALDLGAIWTAISIDLQLICVEGVSHITNNSMHILLTASLSVLLRIKSVFQRI